MPFIGEKKHQIKWDKNIIFLLCFVSSSKRVSSGTLLEENEKYDIYAVIDEGLSFFLVSD
jgi:hypothetical protein